MKLQPSWLFLAALTVSVWEERERWCRWGMKASGVCCHEFCKNSDASLASSFRKKSHAVFTKIWSSAGDFEVDNVSCAANLLIRMISEGSCDSDDAENVTGIHYIRKSIQIENCYFILITVKIHNSFFTVFSIRWMQRWSEGETSFKSILKNMKFVNFSGFSRFLSFTLYINSDVCCSNILHFTFM